MTKPKEFISKSIHVDRLTMELGLFNKGKIISSDISVKERPVNQIEANGLHSYKLGDTIKEYTLLIKYE